MKISFVVLCGFLLLGRIARAHTIVSTALGEIRGVVLRAENGRNFTGFLGIPYAKPPLKSLRFAPPTTPEPWTGIFNATVDSPKCIQANDFFGNGSVIGSEDCLYLNIYVPKLPHEDDSYPYPVMIWIHGGSWLRWSGTMADFPPGRLMRKDLILVTINYRLGWFGFLSTEDEVVPGNNGLKDQVAAIKWVKEHISSFGGDPDRITLGGQDTGAISAHLHSLSPMTKQLIFGVIAQSGTALDPRTIHYPGEALNKAKLLANSLSCSTNDNRNMVDCLRNVEADKIAQTISLLRIWKHLPDIPLRAVIEHSHSDAFLLEHPEKTIRYGKQARVPLLVGTVANEGAFYTLAWSSLIRELNSSYRTVFPVIFSYEEYHLNNTEKNVTDSIKNYYFDSNEIGSNSTWRLEKALNTRFYKNPLNLLIDLQRANNTIYLYRLNYRGSNSFASLFDTSLEHSDKVCHYDDLRYLFNLSHILGKVENDVSQGETLMIESITELWYNFLAIRKPTPETTELLPVKWEHIGQDRKDPIQVLMINGPQNFTMEWISQDELTKESFWNDLALPQGTTYNISSASRMSFKDRLNRFFQNIKNGFKKMFG